VHGEITSMRYGGEYKSYGPQYVRGILEGNGVPPDKNLWVTYSVNKEDIWVSCIPVPVKEVAESQANEVFNAMHDGEELREWNTYSPLRAPVKIAKAQTGDKVLALTDADPFDYAKAERIVPASKKIQTSFSVVPQQNKEGLLAIEFQDAKGTPGIRITFDDQSTLRVKAGYREKNLIEYTAGTRYNIDIQVDTDARTYNLMVNGKDFGEHLLFAPLKSVSRIAFRTGEVRRFPNADTPTDQKYDLPNGDARIKPVTFYIPSLKTSNLEIK